MNYDAESEEFIALEGGYEIHPFGRIFLGSESILLEDLHSSLRIQVGRIDEIIEGLRRAKKKALGE